MTTYDIALSFAGEDRPYVQQVATALQRAGVAVFYDEYERATLWGKDLYVHLSEVYSVESRYTVLFISKFYAEKLWPSHERRAAQERAFRERTEYILPARFDDTDVPGLLITTGTIDLRQLTLDAFVDIILEKIGRCPTKLVRRPDMQPRIVELLRRIYDPGYSLADCIAQALTIGVDTHGESLREFCNAELGGYTDIAGKPAGGTPEYRRMTVHCTFGELDLRALGVAGLSPMSAVAQNRVSFTERTFNIREPVATLEPKLKSVSAQGCWLLTRTARDFDITSVDPETTINCYAAPDAYLRIAAGIRAQLTRLLRDMLQPN